MFYFIKRNQSVRVHAVYKVNTTNEINEYDYCEFWCFSIFKYDGNQKSNTTAFCYVISYTFQYNFSYETINNYRLFTNFLQSLHPSDTEFNYLVDILYNGFCGFKVMTKQSERCYMWKMWSSWKALFWESKREELLLHERDKTQIIIANLFKFLQHG